MIHVARVAVGLAVLLLVPACKSDPTVGPAPGNFSLLTPAASAIGVAVTPTFTWEASFSVETPTYTIQVSTDPTFATTTISQTGLSTTSFTPASALNAGTVYYWQVSAVRSTFTVAATGGPWSFTTISATPGPFTMNAPPNLSTGVSLTPTFSWNASAGAASYTLQVATNSGFTSPVVNQAGLSATSLTLTTPLSASTLYYWQVIAVSTASTTATGAPWTFTTGTGNGVTLTAPASGATAVSRTPTFTWSFTGATPASYTLQVSTDPSFSSTFAINQSSITSTSFTATTALAATTTYTWRVQSFNSSNQSLATSSSFTFTTGP